MIKKVSSNFKKQMEIKISTENSKLIYKFQTTEWTKRQSYTQPIDNTKQLDTLTIDHTKQSDTQTFDNKKLLETQTINLTKHSDTQTANITV